MKRFRTLMIVAACALTGVALPVLAGGFGDGFGGGAGAGLAYLATQFCALTGCTMTGQQVFNGVTTDISTGTNQDLTITPNGTGVVVVSSDFSVTGTGNGIANIRAAATSNQASLFLYVNGVLSGNVTHYGSGTGFANLSGRTALLNRTSAPLVLGHAATDIAAGSPAVLFCDGTNCGNTLGDIDGAGRVRPLLYGSQTNCSDGAGAAACTAAPTGSVVIDAAATTVTVSTTAVTASSLIFVQEDSSLGTKNGVTCNTTTGRTYTVTARTAATSFVVTASAAPVTNPACLSYFIVN